MAAMEYPRVLIVALGRINAADNFNNGLLLRNLFAQWPRENLAQIFSSGDNGDAGFFGRYYQLGPQDRWFGELFYRLKSEVQQEFLLPKISFSIPHERSAKSRLFAWGKRFLIDTGLYELIFRPRISREMERWVRDFKPDIIFAQGYNLAFTWLPLMLAQRFEVPIAYYPTDDWPNNSYHPRYSPLLSRLTRYFVIKTSTQLVDTADICIAFNYAMQQKYRERYHKDFKVLMHGDDFKRFVFPRNAETHKEGSLIVTMGVFNRHRFTLLYDLDRACEILTSQGLSAHAIVYLAEPISEMYVNSFHYVKFRLCPSHCDIPRILSEADLLFLPERFDDTVDLISLSVSTKAHLFMFSGKPIVVYSHPVTGIAHYAREYGWAAVVDRRDPNFLANKFKLLLTNKEERRRLIANAYSTAMKNHNLQMIQSLFHEWLVEACERR
ncbi:MAG: hypothetical protein QXT45_06890 [Candidatus Bilamarchaeaceae archaeon]